QDWDFVLRLVGSGGIIYYLHDPLVLYDARDSPDKKSAQPGGGPTLTRLREARAGISPRAWHWFYLNVLFLTHVRQSPIEAVRMLISATLAHGPSWRGTFAYATAALSKRLSRGR